MKKVSLIVVAAGASARMRQPGSHVRKPFLKLRGKPILFRALEAFLGLKEIGEVCLAVHPDDLSLIREKLWGELARLGVSAIVAGGERRQDSVANALAACNDKYDYVAIHDAARPLVSRSSIKAVFASAFEHGAAILAVPVADTVKKGTGGTHGEPRGSGDANWEQRGTGRNLP
ncbi:MAG: 2-C-methyl-D-erythritol 4-phosphate cytidylyltransferase, partial [Planctomycetota bacterium]|nr:2-C-methyl-D-erythritol 4-phosphate cytidylyltransferase [Planctomycetota bacterium]